MSEVASSDHHHGKPDVSGGVPGHGVDHDKRPFKVEIVYNGVKKPFEVHREELAKTSS